MSKWKRTPFSKIEAAHKVALRLGLQPSVITDTGGGFKCFQIREGRQKALIAQKHTGGPVLEKRIPQSQETGIPQQDSSVEGRLLSGPWTISSHRTLEDVKDHYRGIGPASRHSISFEGELLTIQYPPPAQDEYEYRQPVAGPVEARVLCPAEKQFLDLYERPRFYAGPWAKSNLRTLAEVEAFWKSKFDNFDNVEVLHITLYRIGRDEYEYLQEGLSTVWSRLLSRPQKNVT